MKQFSTIMPIAIDVEERPLSASCVRLFTIRGTKFLLHWSQSLLLAFFLVLSFLSAYPSRSMIYSFMFYGPMIFISVLVVSWVMIDCYRNSSTNMDWSQTVTWCKFFKFEFCSFIARSSFPSLLGTIQHETGHLIATRMISGKHYSYIICMYVIRERFWNQTASCTFSKSHYASFWKPVKQLYMLTIDYITNLITYRRWASGWWSNTLANGRVLFLCTRRYRIHGRSKGSNGWTFDADSISGSLGHYLYINTSRRFNAF